MIRPLISLALAICSATTIASAQTSSSPLSRQPALGSRSGALLTVDGLHFKDLNRNGHLDPYEDWRLSPQMRAEDLVSRMSVDELAGLMVHGNLPGSGTLAVLGNGAAYDLAKVAQLVNEKHINSFITRLNADAETFAVQNNAVQAVAESSRLGIPITISTDPRSHFQEVLGASSAATTFSLWPEPLGFGALPDPAITRQFADVVRQEYLAVGIRESLAPQADLATEPRWARANGTFGEDSAAVESRVNAYVAGMQNGSGGLGPASVATVVKHWAGYGAAKDGWDGHNFYGRFASLSNQSFADHLKPFRGAFAANVAGVMPTYAILQGVSLNGVPLEPVGAGFSKQLLTDLLRDQYGFRGVVVSDWGITSDCNQACHDGTAPGVQPGPKEIGMPWGVESLTRAQRFAKSINAGVDQVGGTDEAALIAEDVRNGLITDARVRAAATRILVQKFQLGLFEQPYVDQAQAASIVGNPNFRRLGRLAQAHATVLLKNEAGTDGHPLLPLRKAGLRVFVSGIDPKAVASAGFIVVESPAQAELAIIRARPPYGSEHPNFFFGGRQHEGRLNFTDADPGFGELIKASSKVPTVFVTTLERPLILSDVLPHATALLGSFGIEDATLLDLLTGKLQPEGRLPFELPSSAAAVQAQRSDLPHDSVAPLFVFGFGLSYPAP